MAGSDGDTEVWLQRLAAGHPDAVERFWNEYAAPLERLASGRLSPALKRRVGSDDILQSVCRTFFRRSKMGDYEITESEQLWRLLCAITINKVQQHARFHHRHRRNVQREQHAVEEGEMPLIEAVQDQQASQEEAIAFIEQMQYFLNAVDDEERQLIEYRLDGLSNQQIAEKAKISERTVRRIVASVRSRWERMLNQLDRPG